MKKIILSMLVALMATTGATAQIAVSGEGNTRTFTMPAYPFGRICNPTAANISICNAEKHGEAD